MISPLKLSNINILVLVGVHGLLIVSCFSSVPARNFCFRAKVAPTTHFLGPDISRKGQCTSIFLIWKREEAVGKLRK